MSEYSGVLIGAGATYAEAGELEPDDEDGLE